MPIRRWIALGVLVVSLVAASWTPAGAAGGPSTHSVTLEWTAPGDDSLVGTAHLYDIRYSRTPITDANYNISPRVNAYLLPGPAGTKQRLTIFGLTPGIQYFFAMRSCDAAGNWSRISNIVSYYAGTLDASDGASVEAFFSSPWPNPASSLTRFTLSLPEPRWVRIEAFDLAGRRVGTIAIGEYGAGTVDLSWNLRDESGRTVRAGTYLVRGQIGENVFLRRVTVVH